MKTKVLLITLQFMSIIIFCQENSVVKDVEGNTYKTVKIKDIEWMAENLRVSCFNDTKSIIKTSNIKEWDEAGRNNIPMFTDFTFSEEEAQGCGFLYNWHAISHPSGLCPKGWRIPTYKEWLELYEYKAVNIKSKKGWHKYYDTYEDTEFDTNGTDKLGFNALACSYNTYDFLNEKDLKEFSPNFGIATNWASSSEFEDDKNKVWYISLYYVNGDINYSVNEKQELATFVRCVKSK